MCTNEHAPSPMKPNLRPRPHVHELTRRPDTKHLHPLQTVGHTLLRSRHPFNVHAHGFASQHDNNIADGNALAAVGACSCFDSKLPWPARPLNSRKKTHYMQLSTHVLATSRKACATFTSYAGRFGTQPETTMQTTTLIAKHSAILPAVIVWGGRPTS